MQISWGNEIIFKNVVKCMEMASKIRDTLNEPEHGYADAIY
jgi:hypothetical protein